QGWTWRQRLLAEGFGADTVSPHRPVGAGTGQTVSRAGGGAPAGPCSLLRDGLEPLELLLSDRRIELDEARGGLGDRLAGCDRSVLPGGDVGVVAGDDRVARPAVEILDLLDAGHRRDLALPAQCPLHRVRG